MRPENRMSPSTVTLEDALKLLELPRTIAVVEGEPIVAQNGKYGPYIAKGKETRSLGSEDELFTVTKEQALAILAQPKTRPGRQARGPVAPLKELGEDPVSKKKITLKEGRFGHYVTDGDTSSLYALWSNRGADGQAMGVSQPALEKRRQWCGLEFLLSEQIRRADGGEAAASARSARRDASRSVWQDAR